MQTRVRVLLLFALVVYLSIEAMVFVGLWVLESRLQVAYDPVIETLSDEQRTRLQAFVETGSGASVQQDPVLGWYEVGNAAGMRDDREYETTPPPGVVRISAFGDSFTFGANVEIEETWTRHLGDMEPAREVLNYGSGGYGLDQAYLRYLEVGTDYDPDIVLIGYMSENIARDVNVFRAFYTRWYRGVIFTKPRFQLEDGALKLLPNPVATVEDHRDLLAHDREVLARLGSDDYHYQMRYRRGKLDFLPSVRFLKIVLYELRTRVLDPIFLLDGMYNVESEAYQVTSAIFDAFYRSVLEEGALPVIVVFPDLTDQQRGRDRQERRYKALLDGFAAKGYRFIDTQEALEPYEEQYSIVELTRDWGHYSPVGNQIMAEYIGTQLRDWQLMSVPEVEAATRVEQERLGIERH